MTYTEAKDELYGIVLAAINDGIDSAAVPAIEMRWPGVPIIASPPNDGYWGRVFYTTVRDVQASLAKNKGVSRYSALGQLIVQIYSPVSIVGSIDNGNLLAELVRNYFRRPSPSGVLSFTNQQVREVGNTDTHYQTNVMVECHYDNYQ
jgi:hypothetical protein